MLYLYFKVKTIKREVWELYVDALLSLELSPVFCILKLKAKTLDGKCKRHKKYAFPTKILAKIHVCIFSRKLLFKPKFQAII